MKNTNGFISELLSGKLSGHPIHMMLVHFPIAFLPLSAILDLISLLNQSSYFAELGFYAAAIGAVTGGLAALFGSLDLIRIKNNPMLLQKALIHGGLNFFAIMIFAVIAGIRYKQFPSFEIINLWIVTIEFCAVTIIMFSNYLGGELVLRYGMGRKSG